MRDKFLFFRNFKNVADKLPDELRLKFYDAITNYVFEGIEPDDAVIAALVGAIKPSLNKEDKRGGNHNPTGQNQHSEVKRGQTRSNEVKNNFKQDEKNQRGQSFLEIRNKKQENNISSGKPSEILQKKIPDDSGMMDIEELIAQTPPKPKPKEKPFQPPTLNEIEAYIAERNCAAVVDAKKFFDYFNVGGWKDSTGRPVKNWKQKIITWEMEGRKQRTIKAAAGLLGVKSGTYGKEIPL